MGHKLYRGLVAKLHGKINAVSHRHGLTDVVIERDPLYRISPVHKFDVLVRHADLGSLIQIRHFLILDLLAEGWHPGASVYSLKRLTTTYGGHTVDVFIDRVIHFHQPLRILPSIS